jgi:hypothetical protein
MKTAAKAIEKLHRPPSAHNWAKNIRPRRDDTAFALHNFALYGPTISLQPIVQIIKQVAVDGLDLEQALKCLQKIKDPRVRVYGDQILRVLVPFALERGWRGIEVFADLVEYYPVAAGVRVPVRPTFVLNVDGKLVPYFVICWAKMDLTPYQKRILATLISEAILSLEEFEGCEAVIVCTPRHRFSRTERTVIEWSSSNHQILDDGEKQILFDRYAGALADAERMIIDSLS